MSADWQGDRQWQEKMRRAAELANMTDVFNDAIDEVVIPELREHFESEGRGQWPRLSDAYESRKKKLYGDRPILQATGATFRSLTGPEGEEHQVRIVEPGGAVFGTDLPYPQFHQKRPKRKGRKRRRIINRTRDFRKRLRDFIAGRLAAKLRRL
jgi:phage gpG-like protein